MKDSLLLVNTEEVPDDHFLVHICNKYKLENVAEIGVFGGNLTKRSLSLCPQIKCYYAVDPWKVYVESYDRPAGASEKEQSFWEQMFEKVMEIQHLFPEKMKILRRESVSAALHLKKELESKEDLLDIVYIDAIHDEVNLCNDIYAWLPLIKENGVISGHDYIKRYLGMMKLLDDLFGENLNFWHLDKSKSRYSYKNQGQGGNWWVNLNLQIRSEVVKKIETKYQNFLFKENKK